MEEKISPLAKGILDGLEEALQDVKGVPVDGMRKTTVYVDPHEKTSLVTAHDMPTHGRGYRKKTNAKAV